MDRRVIVLFCLLMAVGQNQIRSEANAAQPKISVNKDSMTLDCKDGTFDKTPSLKEDVHDTYTCTPSLCIEEHNANCAKQEVTVKILSSENLIQPDMTTVASVIVSDILATVLIGWAVYSICAQPKTRGGYQGNKASDRVNLINNHTPSGGDTYQPLNTRADEYSTLQTQRKHKNKQSV